jgi:deazaflavin-dependent oxidoreductase (nitroreductase family)
MKLVTLESVASEQVLYLTTIGRVSALPREIEIWLVIWRERFLPVAETSDRAGWVKNIKVNPKVTVRVGELQIEATARILDRHLDRELWSEAAAIADRKYGWSEGMPVEITPLPSHPGNSSDG